MSYTYLLDAGEVSSAESFSDIPASVLSRLNLTASESCSNVSATESCLDSLSGTMCEPSTANHGAGGLTLCAEGSLAKTSVLLATDRELRESEVACGASSHESLARYDQKRRLWKTHQRSLFGGYAEFSGTWPAWGLMRGGESWALPTPLFLQEIRQFITTVSESGSSLKAPTPNTQGFRSDGELRLLAKMVGEEEFYAMSDRAAESKRRRALKAATPTVNGNYNQKGASPKSGDGLATQVGGKLNPQWVEWLMGWPIGWTELKPLAMAKFQSWLHSHGKH